MNQTCAAVYARFSSDRQNPDSIAQQIRRCQNHADKNGWHIAEAHVYADEAMSAQGTDRPGLQKLLAAALHEPRPFDILLIDDTSRISRNIADAMRLFERLTFMGIRVVAVSQGIDTQHEQADVQMTVHALVDSLYVKELAKKTHRGLDSLARKGLSTGGRCYGYDSRKTDGGTEFVVNPEEAAIVLRIFRMSAEGQSLKRIAKALNREGVSAPRPRKGRRPAGWCPTAIRSQLHNRRYVGVLEWNKTRFIKVPGTNRRVSRPRPREEWLVVETPLLRVVPQELWDQVHRRLAWVKSSYSTGARQGLLARSASSRHLFSGFLVCSECGGRLTVVAGQRKGGHRRLGCPRYVFRGTCSNDLRERQVVLEARLLSGLQAAVLDPAAVEYTLERFEAELKKVLRQGNDGGYNGDRRRKTLQEELGRLAQAVAQHGHSPALLDAIAIREGELVKIEAQARKMPDRTGQPTPANRRAFVTKRLLTCPGY